MKQDFICFFFCIAVTYLKWLEYLFAIRQYSFEDKVSCAVLTLICFIGCTGSVMMTFSEFFFEDKNDPSFRE